MSDPVEFLLARIAEDEDVASHEDGGILDMADAWFNKTRVLAECKAKRRIVERHGLVETGIISDHGGQDEVRYCGSCGTDLDEGDCPDLLYIAAVYADHADYDEGWAPSD